MSLNNLKHQKVKKKYLKFIKSQEVLSEPFRDKISQLNNFYIPIGHMIYKNFQKNKKTQIIGLTGGQGSGKSTISNILKIILKSSFFTIDIIAPFLLQIEQLHFKTFSKLSVIFISASTSLQ